MLYTKVAFILPMTVVTGKRKRHIRVANSYLYEEVTIHKTIAIKYVRSDENCADMMTKCLSAPLFRKHRSTLMGRV